MRDVEYNFRITPKDELSEDHQNYYNDFLEKLVKLTLLEQESGDAESLKVPTGIADQIKMYREAFVATVDAWRVKGMKEGAGLRGQLSEDVKRSEQAIDRLALSSHGDTNGNIWRDFYQVRNLEESYFQTLDAQYADSLVRLIEEIRGRLGSSPVSDGLPVAVTLETYRDHFLAMVEQDRRIQELSEAMEEANHAIEFLVEYHFSRVAQDTHKASESTQAFGRERTRLAFAMATVLIVLMIGIAFLLVVGVVRPISRVTRAMLHVSDGHLDSQVPVVGVDELGQMATIFNTMAMQLRAAHNGLQNEQEKLTTILLSAREGIVGTDRDGRVVLVNPAAVRLLEKSEETIIEGGFLNLLDDPDYVQQFLLRAGIDMPDTLFYKGKVLNFFAASIEDRNGEVVGSAALIRDVTEEKKLERMLRDLSNTDGLTQLLNRRRFDELMQIEFQRARRYGMPLGLLLFDVDHFKKFNDTYGHDQGDRVLQALAKTMIHSFRDVDFCCRYGGEEFCVITPNTATPGLLIAAERFREKVEALVIDGLKVTISIGAVVYPLHLPHAKGPAELFKAADDALYAAKRGGRNQVREASLQEGSGTAATKA
ncbi:MAG: diguanylate cyclase [Magnetococcales bacterium]|nr:diguanylate cyclase [Magnetococcales bacterium]